jgi:alpha-D-ribose 1-methylphosphonate 5-triphosphate synthase subunit PhnH
MMMRNCRTMHDSLQSWQRDARAEQAAFRALLQALSYPGRVVELPAAHGPAWLQALACLIDASTELADVTQWISPSLWLQLGAKPTAAERSRFVLAEADQPPAFEPCLGTLESPEGGATVLLRCAAVGEGPALRLSGPGIRQTVATRATGVHPQWWASRERWCASFPTGVDFLLADDHRLLALPRTTLLAPSAPASPRLVEESH